MSTDITDKVEAGIEWLDGYSPGWERSIDLASFCLESGCHCILGQVFNTNAKEQDQLHGYNYVFNVLIPGDHLSKAEWSVEHGFSEYSGPAYQRLENEWIRQIKARYETGKFSG